MRLYFSLFMLLFIWGCMETLEIPPLKEETAKKTIQDNKTEAEKAKDAYLKLQQKRRQNG